MKKVFGLILVLIMCICLFAACGKISSNSESGSVSQPDASISLPQEDASSSATSPDASQPEEETPAPEVNPEEKPQAPAPEVNPEQKPETPAPEAKPEEPAPQPEQKPATVELNAFFESIFTDPDNSPALIPMEVEALDAFYPGLTALSLKQTVAYMPMMTAVPCEIVMVECANGSDVDTVKALFQARIDAQVNDHFNYPMVIEAWETEAKVVSNGNFVALFVVSGMTEQVVANFNALF